MVWCATTEDALATARMLHDFNREFDEFSPGESFLAPRVTTLIEEGSKHFLIGRLGDGGSDGDPDGFAQVDFRPSVWSEGPVALLEEFYVRPEKRSSGLGKELMTAVLDLARSREAAMVEVVTGEDDIAARGLYESTGFSNLIEGEGNASSLYYELEL